MKLKVDEVLSCFQVINKIMYDKQEERRLPFKIKLKLTRIKDVFEKTIELYENQRLELVRKYGDPVKTKSINEDGVEVEIETGNISVSNPDKMKKFSKEIGEVLNEESEYNFEKIPKDYITLIEDIEMDISERDIKVLFIYLVDNES